jgi:hypothetical protein
VKLGVTHPLTEMSTRNHFEDKEWLVHKADNPVPICELTD